MAQLDDLFNAIPSQSPLRKKSILYSDFHMDLSINPITEDLALKTNEEAIKESLRNIILTDRGERLFQPNLGSDVRASLFENANPVSLKILEERVRDAIDNFEPRVSVIDVDLLSIYDDNTVQITIQFYIRNREDPLQLSMFIERVR